MRFCTVARETRNAFASDTSEARASLRSRPISCWSTSSMQAPRWHFAPLGKHFALRVQLCDQSAGYSLASTTQKIGTAVQTFRQSSFIMVDYIGVADIRRIVCEIGVAQVIERLADEIEADYRRWAAFDKEARVASHSAVGVIELMPISDGQRYSFKYVNGHPGNTAAGLLTA